MLLLPMKILKFVLRKFYGACDADADTKLDKMEDISSSYRC